MEFVFFYFLLNPLCCHRLLNRVLLFICWGFSIFTKLPVTHIQATPTFLIPGSTASSIEQFPINERHPEHLTKVRRHVTCLEIHIVRNHRDNYIRYTRTMENRILNQLFFQTHVTWQMQKWKLNQLLYVSHDRMINDL